MEIRRFEREPQDRKTVVFSRDDSDDFLIKFKSLIDPKYSDYLTFHFHCLEKSLRPSFPLPVTFAPPGSLREKSRHKSEPPKGTIYPRRIIKNYNHILSLYSQPIRDT